MPTPYKRKLRAALPKSGMKYHSEKKLMHNHRREKRVTDSLKAAGYQITHAAITSVLVDLFRKAAPIVAEAHAQGEALWDSLSRVQTEIDWARNLPEAIFFELVVRFVEARYEWEKNPTYPYYAYELYNPAVVELVKFLASIGDHGANNSWVLTDAVFFNELARGLDVDEDEDEDTMMMDYNPHGSGFSDENEDPIVGDPIVGDIVPPLAQMTIQEEEL
ncbi:hypothetical protein ONZ43_g885 [Nemania bipapillata]|uniref:Uncharacterized protein n=1 Tax=Nemania bipapillata TaxID=110536 RepID=A0ACC2J6S3_9PEZI|nr:hypothetical protein ONZ43_g885 [Nemania bipapillata]